LNTDPNPAAVFSRIELKNLFSIAAWQNTISWQRFNDKFDIHRLYGDGVTGPTAALLRCREAGTIPPHVHAGYEHILVLCGSERDQNSEASAGTIMINPPGSRHQVSSDAGSIVLAIWEAPVRPL
jgi:quercetin dioxygenase-like cupin family protein